MGNEDLPSIWHLREIQSLLGWLRNRESRLIRNVDLREWQTEQRQGFWNELLKHPIGAHKEEAGRAEIAVDTFVEWLAEWGRGVRRRQQGLVLTTAHRAMGLEFDHVIVLDGGWDRVGRDEDTDAPRRLYYVSKTRARQTLALSCLGEPNLIQNALRDCPAVVWREPFELPSQALELRRRYRQLNLRDVFLSFAGRMPSHNRVRVAIAALSPNDPPKVRQRSSRWELLDRKGVVVGRLARDSEPREGMVCTHASVLAIATWNRKHSDPEYQEQLQCDAWEVVVPELIFEPS